MRGTRLLNVIFRGRDISTEPRFINRNPFPWTKKISVFTNTKALICLRLPPPLPHCLFYPLSHWLTVLSGINTLASMAKYNTSNLLGAYKCGPNGRTITAFGRGCRSECGAAGKGPDGKQWAATLRVARPLADWMGTCKESHPTQCRYKHQHVWVCVCVGVCLGLIKALSQQQNYSNHQRDTGRLLIL